MPLLFWQAIQQAKSEQLREFDLGRSESSNEGLIRFKDHLGASKTCLTYCRSSGRLNKIAGDILQRSVAQKLLLHLPNSLFRLAGEIFYRHAG